MESNPGYLLKSFVLYEIWKKKLRQNFRYSRLISFQIIPQIEEKDLTESHLFDLPGEDDNLDRNMPWLGVMTKLLNSFNYHCTHQTFCHPQCYRRQMRAARRIMEATRHVSFMSYSSYELIIMPRSHCLSSHMSNRHLWPLKKSKSGGRFGATS